jgi:hypothetical protein
MILLAQIKELFYYLINSFIQGGLILRQGYVPEKVMQIEIAQIEHRIPI